MSVHKLVLVACAVLAAASIPASPAAAVPASLRTPEDAEDLAETFMSHVVEGDLRTAHRLAARYGAGSPAEIAERISEAEARRKQLRATLGLSNGSEPVSTEQAGERVLRIRHLERFDDGALVWRFLFYRADRAWQLVEVSETDQLGVLFGEPERAPVPPGAPPEPEATLPDDGDASGR